MGTGFSPHADRCSSCLPKRVRDCRLQRQRSGECHDKSQRYVWLVVSGCRLPVRSLPAPAPLPGRFAVLGIFLTHPALLMWTFQSTGPASILCCSGDISAHFGFGKPEARTLGMLITVAFPAGMLRPTYPSCWVLRCPRPTASICPAMCNANVSFIGHQPGYPQCRRAPVYPCDFCSSPQPLWDSYRAFRECWLSVALSPS